MGSVKIQVYLVKFVFVIYQLSIYVLGNSAENKKMNWFSGKQWFENAEVTGSSPNRQCSFAHYCVLHPGYFLAQLDVEDPQVP